MAYLSESEATTAAPRRVLSRLHAQRVALAVLLSLRRGAGHSVRASLMKPRGLDRELADLQTLPAPN